MIGNFCEQFSNHWKLDNTGRSMELLLRGLDGGHEAGVSCYVFSVCADTKQELHATFSGSANTKQELHATFFRLCEHEAGASCYVFPAVRTRSRSFMLRFLQCGHEAGA